MKIRQNKRKVNYICFLCLSHLMTSLLSRVLIIWHCLISWLTDWLNVFKSCKYGLFSEKEKYCLSCNNYDKIRNESEISKICNKLLCFFVSSFLTFHDMLRWFFTYGGGGIDIKCFATIMQIGVTLLYPWGRGSFGETIERANGWCFGCR